MIQKYLPMMFTGPILVAQASLSLNKYGGKPALLRPS